MTLTKEQLLNNLIKYNAISVNEAKRFNLSKRESIVRFMNEHLPANIIKEIYEYEYCTDKDEKDYTPIAGFNPYLSKQSEEKVEMVYDPEQKGFVIKEEKSIFYNFKQEISEKGPETIQEEILRGRPKKDKNKVTVGDLLFQGKLKNVNPEQKKEMLKNAISDEKVQKILDKIEENY